MKRHTRVAPAVALPPQGAALSALDVPTLVKLAALPREIAKGRVTASFTMSNEEALRYDEHGSPT